MPYGTKNETDATKPQVSGKYTQPGFTSGTFSCMTPYGTSKHMSSNYVRTGTNRNPKVGLSCEKPPGTFKLVAVQVPKGPRLSYKVYSKRLKKYVWARKPITIFRLKKVPTKSKPAKGLDLLPNALSYSGNRVIYYGGSQGNIASWKGVMSDPRYSREYSGDLWSNFLVMGSSWQTVGPNAQNYTGSGVSTRYSAAVAGASSKALSAFYEAVKNQKVNLAQALAERAQTASLVREGIQRFVTALRAVRKGNLSKASRALFPGNSKELANDWLLLQYGIKPLLSDIEGAASLLKEPATFQFDIKKTKRVKLERQLIDVSSQPTGNPPHVTKVFSEGYVDVTYKARVRVSAELGRYAASTGLTNPLSLAWELTPYSFVFDWLLPLGDYLNNQDAFSGLSLVYVTKTVFIKENIDFERQLGGTNAGYVWPKQLVGFRNERYSCVRTIENIVPPLPYPSFKDPISAGHVANAIALLRQLKK